MQTDTTHSPGPSRPTSRLRHLVLRPGVHVLRRSADELQLGLDPSRAVVLPDNPSVRTLLTALTSPGSVGNPHAYDDPALALLAGAGLLVDADALLPLIPTSPRASSPGTTAPGATAPGTTGHRVDRAEVAAIAAHSGDEAGERLDARSAARVEVMTFGAPGVLRIAAELTDLLVASGVHCREDQRRPRAAGRTAPTAAVVVAVGEPPREGVDPLVRAGTPHLFLRLAEGHAVVGPFVVPGETACLRCVDAHHTDVDAVWPLLVTQYASAVAHEREDTVPEPVDPLLATLASAWAARELVSFAEGRRPATASTTVRLDPHLTALETQSWPPHPACGCAWA